MAGKTINWTFNVQVSGGSKVSNSATISPEAVDNIALVIGKKTGAEPEVVEVEVQPSADVDQVEFLLITRADQQYDDNLSYQVHSTDPTENGTSHVLDGPHLLIGKGAVGLLGKVPDKLFFSNASDSVDIPVEILVARDATPTP